MFNTENIEQLQSQANAQLNYYAHLLINTATGAAPRHKYYNRASALQKTYRALLNISEADIDVLPLSQPQKDLLRKFKRERTEAEFEQAISRIVSTTKGMLESVINVFNDTIKAVKPNPNTLRFTTEQGNSNADALKRQLGNYYGNKSVQQYCYQTYAKKSAHSFNSWHVTELPSQGTGNTPYPVEIAAKDALNWGFQNNALQYLLARKDFYHAKSDGKIFCADAYIVWLPFYTLELLPVAYAGTISGTLIPHSRENNYTEYLLEMVAITLGQPSAIFSQDVTYYVTPDEQRIAQNSTIYLKTPTGNADKAQYWALKIYPHLAPVVPATRFGYAEDLYADAAINTSYLHAGIEAVLKAMQDNKVLEESKQNNAYPREAHYVRDCEDCNGSGTIEQPCDRQPTNGETLFEKTDCAACGGTGKLRPRTATDVIEVPYPPQDIIMKAGGLPALDNLSTTFPTDMTTIEFLNNQLKQHEETLHRRIFRSVHFMTEKSYSTATEVEFDSRATYGAIYDCAQHMADCIKFHTYLCAWYLGMYEGLVFDFGIPADLRNLSEVQVAELIAKYAESGVPQFIRREMHLRLIDITYPNDYEAALKSRLIAEHDPFFGLSETEKQMRLGSQFISTADKVLSENIVKLFDDYPEVLAMNDRATREEFLRDKAKEILNTLQTEQQEQLDALRQRALPGIGMGADL